MPAMKRLVVATDFTETSDRALEYALDLATALAASITLVHAYEIPIMSFPDGGLIATPEVASRISQVATEALDATIAR